MVVTGYCHDIDSENYFTEVRHNNQRWTAGRWHLAAEGAEEEGLQVSMEMMQYFLFWSAPRARVSLELPLQRATPANPSPTTFSNLETFQIIASRGQDI